MYHLSFDCSSCQKLEDSYQAFLPDAAKSCAATGDAGPSIPFLLTDPLLDAVPEVLELVLAWSSSGTSVEAVSRNCWNCARVYESMVLLYEESVAGGEPTVEVEE